MITGKGNGVGGQVDIMSGEFEKWIQDTLPEPREEAIEARINLAILRDRMRRSSPSRGRGAVRFLAVAVPTAAVIFFTGGVVELGSDDFALEETVLPSKSQPVLIKDFENLGINVLPEDTRAEIKEIVQQRAAGEATLRGVEGWLIDGKTHWSLTRVYRVNGEEKETSADPIDPPTELTQDMARFLVTEWNEIEEKIAAGTLRSTGTDTVVLDGVACTVSTYVFMSGDWGEVTYYLGGPTP